MDKENVVILYRLRNERNSSICHKKHKLWGYCSKWNNPVTELEMLHDSTYMSNIK